VIILGYALGDGRVGRLPFLELSCQVSRGLWSLLHETSKLTRILGEVKKLGSAVFFSN
jgi:hypothetical protein